MALRIEWASLGDGITATVVWRPARLHQSTFDPDVPPPPPRPLCQTLSVFVDRLDITADDGAPLRAAYVAEENVVFLDSDRVSAARRPRVERRLRHLWVLGHPWEG